MGCASSSPDVVAPGAVVPTKPEDKEPAQVPVPPVQKPVVKEEPAVVEVTQPEQKVEQKVENTPAPEPKKKEVDTSCASKAEHLTALADMLSGALSGLKIDLSGATIPAPENSSEGSSAWFNEKLWPVQAMSPDEMTGNGLRIFSTESRSPDDVKVCLVKGPNTTLENGVLELVEDDVLVFDSSCSNVNLKHMVINGGVIVCFGKGCQVNLIECELNLCTIVALNGADVNLEKTSLYLPCTPGQDDEEDEENDEENEEDDIPPPEGLGLFLSGKGTTVKIKGGLIMGGAQGITVQDGATCVIVRDTAEEGYGSRFTVRDATVTGIEVCGSGASVELSDVHVCSGEQMAGVYVHSNAAAKLHSVICDGASAGFLISHEGTAELYRCHAEGNAAEGARIVLGATAHLKECWIQNSDCGINAGGEGTKVTAELCCIQDNDTHGVLSEDSASVILTKCFVGGSEYEDCEESDGTIEQIDMIDAILSDINTPAFITFNPEWAVDGVWEFS